MRIQLQHDDCLKRLDAMEADTIEVSVSDPPYDLTSGGGGGFMGKQWDGTGISFSQEFWTRLFRVMAPGGIVKVFGGTRTFHRMAVAMETAGFVLRPKHSLEAWTYGSGFPKSMNIEKALLKQGVDPEVAKRFRGYGTALKPAWEPILIGQKPR